MALIEEKYKEGTEFNASTLSTVASTCLSGVMMEGDRDSQALMKLDVEISQSLSHATDSYQVHHTWDELLSFN